MTKPKQPDADKAADDKLTAAAGIAEEVKRKDAETAAEVKRKDAETASELKVSDAKIAATAKTLEFYRTIMLPIALALMAALPGIIAAWRINAAEIRLTEVQRVGVDTHTLVNSNMHVQLKLNAELTRWKANQTGDEADERAAQTAQRMLSEHEAKQAIVDAKADKEKL